LRSCVSQQQASSGPEGPSESKRYQAEVLCAALRDVVTMVHHLAEMLSETSARVARPVEPATPDLRNEVEELRACVRTLVHLVTDLADARAAA
jgi:hypothetical protein